MSTKIRQCYHYLCINIQPNKLIRIQDCFNTCWLLFEVLDILYKRYYEMKNFNIHKQKIHMCSSTHYIHQGYVYLSFWFPLLLFPRIYFIIIIYSYWLRLKKYLPNVMPSNIVDSSDNSDCLASITEKASRAKVSSAKERPVWVAEQNVTYTNHCRAPSARSVLLNYISVFLSSLY